MALLVETGTGVADARSYATVAQLDAYAADFGASLVDASGTAIPAVVLGPDGTPAANDPGTLAREDLLRQGCRALGRYADRFSGKRASGAQVLDWPRQNAKYLDGTDIPSSTIPREIIDANCELAIFAGSNPTAFRTIVSGRQIKAQRLDGLEREYFQSAEGSAVRDIVSTVDDILRPLLKEPPSGSSTQARTTGFILVGGK